jgi:hypothetical protein
MASTYLTRTCGTASNRKIFTFSFWMKISEIASNYNEIFNTWYSSDNRFIFYLNGSNGQFNIFNTTGGSTNTWLQTNRVFRDFNAYYHIYIAVDTTQSTASDRIKLYVNGVQETSFSQNTYPPQNTDMKINPDNTYSVIIGRNGTNNQYYFNGILSHFYYVDGSVIDIAQFGSVDNLSGEWKINTDPTIASFGNEGFLILKDGNTVTDQSPNSNNFTVGGGTLTKTEDSPSNLFATWNPLDFTPPNPPNTVYANGNTSVTTSASTGSSSDVWGTLGAVSGKYYYEIKMTNNPSDSGNTGMSVGWGNSETQERITYYSGNGYQYYDSGSAAYGNTYTQNDIIGCAVDLTNGTIEFYKNGTSQGSITNRITTNTGFWKPLTWDGSGSLTASWNANFGNGYFGTTAVSSAGTNASGIGIFEYDVPTGYTALSTKGLNL